MTIEKTHPRLSDGRTDTIWHVSKRYTIADWNGHLAIFYPFEMRKTLDPWLYFVHRSLRKAHVGLIGFFFGKSIFKCWYKLTHHSRIFRTVETLKDSWNQFHRSNVIGPRSLSVEPWPRRHGTLLTKFFVVGSSGKKSPSIVAPHSITYLRLLII